MLHFTVGSSYMWGNLIAYMPPALQFIDGAFEERRGQIPHASYVLAFSLIMQMVGLERGFTSSRRLRSEAARPSQRLSCRVALPRRSY